MNTIDDKTAGLWEAVTALRHELHRNPELSGQEIETKKRLMAFIRTQSHLKIVDQGDWFYALYEPAEQNGEAPVAFRADMDALPVPETIALPYGSVQPNVAHKCGHDGHAAALAALAALLESDPQVRRPVYLIFQAAEETGKGGKPCADFLSETAVSEVYACHNLSGYPEGAVMVRDGLTQCASTGLLVTFHGERAHAGTPEDGHNPAAAIAELALFANQLQADRGGRLCTVVYMQEGHLDFGISPGDGAIGLTLRTTSDNDLAAMERALRLRAGQLAGSFGLRTDFTVYDPFPATVNDPQCAAAVRQAAAALGLTVADMPEPWRPSEDFGWYTQVRPGAMFYVGNGIHWPMPHQPGFDFNDRILQTIASVFLKLAETR